MTIKILSLCFIICITVLQLGCPATNLSTEKVVILPVWTDEGTPAKIPPFCVNVGSAHGSGKTDEDALRQFKLDVLKKGGNAATLLSGTRNLDADQPVVTHAGLVYKCDSNQLIKH